jgi:hypothetical protein
MRETGALTPAAAQPCSRNTRARRIERTRSAPNAPRGTTAPRADAETAAVMRAGHHVDAAPTPRGAHGARPTRRRRDTDDGARATHPHQRRQSCAASIAPRTNQDIECRSAGSLTPALPAECPHSGFYHATQLEALRLAHALLDADTSLRAPPPLACTAAISHRPSHGATPATLSMCAASALSRPKYDDVALTDDPSPRHPR